MGARLILATIALVCSTTLAVAQNSPPAGPPARVAGVVKTHTGTSLVLHTDDQDITVQLNANTRITRSNKIKLAEVKAGEFIGCTAVEGTDGKLHATEIHLFPESMRGAGEGHYPWDAPKTSMTNGKVEQLTGITHGHAVKVSYKGGVTDIEIPPTVKVTRIEAVAADQLTTGTPVTLFLSGPPGAQVAQFVAIGP